MPIRSACRSEVLSSPDIAVVLVRLAGVRDILQFAASSTKLATLRAAALRETQKRYCLCMFGGVGPPSLSSIEAFDLRHETWETLPPMPCRRHGHAVVVLDGFLYILGGSGGLPSQRDVMRFRPATKMWQNLISMPLPRLDFAAAAIFGKIYVAGGAGNVKASGHPLSAVARFTPPHEGEEACTSGAWEVLPAMSTGRENVAGAAIQGSFYVCGGLRTGGSELRCGERFDVFTNRWKALPLMSAGRAGHAAVVIGGCLVACGGRTHGRATSMVEMLVLGSRSWETLPPMMVRRCRLAATVFNGKIYICGGDSGGTQTVASVERYDPVHKSSELLPNLLVARSRATAAIIMV